MAVTWNREWIHDFESPWSIFEKFKSINKINSHQLISYYGSEEVHSMKNLKLKKIYRDLNTLKGFQLTQIEKALNYNIKEHINSCRYKLSRISPFNVDPDELFHSNLVFCEKCLNLGYHSFLHQFRLLHNCPFHSSELHTACPHCHSTVPYELPDHTIEQGFICVCGNSLVTSVDLSQALPKWEIELPDIKDEEVASLVTTRDIKTDIISNLYVFKPTLYSNYNAISHLLKIAENKIHFNVFTNKKRITQKSMERTQVYKSMYVTLQQVLKSFERYLKNTLLVDHLHCIFRFINLIKKKNEPFGLICPYAYAFVFWSDDFLNVSPFSSKRKHETPNNLTEFKVPFRTSAEDVEQFTTNIFASHQIHQIDLEWTISHLTWHLAKQSYHMWLNIASKYAIKETRPNTIHIDMTHFSELITILINNKDNKIGFLALPGKELMKSTIELSCPNAKKYRRIGAGEYSFLPMKLAINTGLEKEIVETEKYLAKLKLKTFS